MKAKLALILLGVCMISGCIAASAQQLYPVRGPQASPAPPPIFTAKLTGSVEGKISLILANGEAFEGRWSTMRAPVVSANTPQGAANDPPQPSLSYGWDTIYGSGYYLANVVGESVAHSVLTGSQGTILQLDFNNGHFGVAVDSKGNIYKVVWP
jgi:hypothetical protein